LAEKGKGGVLPRYFTKTYAKKLFEGKIYCPSTDEWSKKDFTTYVSASSAELIIEINQALSEKNQLPCGFDPDRPPL